MAGAGRRRDQWIEHHAAEEESGFAGVDSRQMRRRVWRLFGAVPDHEGTADDLQSRHAGGQASHIRRGRSVARVARNGSGGGRNYAPEGRASSGGHRKQLGGGYRFGGRAGTQRSAVSSGSQDGGSAGAGERARFEEA